MYNSYYLPFQDLLSSRSYVTTQGLKYIYIYIYNWNLPWSVILREGHRLKVFENRLLRRIFEPKNEELRGRIMINFFL
jgi:hypothetical protein